MRPGRTYRQRPAGLHSKSNSSRKIIFLLLICVFAAACLIWLRLGGPGIPCLFHLVTALLLADSAYRWVKNEKFSKKTEACAALYCVGLVLFGIFRNLV